MFNLGIIGPGNIAGMMARTVNRLQGVSLYAAGSRSLERAVLFQKKYGTEKAYGSYEELLEDPKVDLVYVAVPHSHHADIMEMCIEHKKNILCEKAFTINTKQAEHILRLSDNKNVFTAEAIWTRYQPMRTIINNIIKEGAIGTPEFLTANLAYELEDVERMNNPSLAGGALLDLGVYALNFAIMVFGKDIENISSQVMMSPLGVDEQETISIKYKDGRFASLFCSKKFTSDRKGFVYGSKGYLEIENINNPQSVKIFDKNYEMVREIKCPLQITGYEYEVLACQKAIKHGKKQPDEMPWEETLYMMSLMDGLRKDWNMKYPMEL